jgi:hypothetical protein
MVAELSPGLPHTPMEPVAPKNPAIAIRPVSGGAPIELADLLRDGRVLAGEVLQSLADGSVVIGIGRHKVPADTHLRLDPGQHFLFQVAAAGEQVVLRVLGPGGGEDGDFWRFLRQVIGEDRPLGELLHELATRVRAELERPGHALDALSRLLASLEHAATLPQGGADLGSLLLRSGQGYEAALLAAAVRGVSPELLDELGRHLKGELLRALADLPDGPLKEAVARALAGIEAEQLLNLARAHSGEAQVLSLPLPDADGWTTARLCIPARRERRQGAAEEEEDAPQRLVLGVSFSRTGPLRVDLIATREALAVRILAQRPELVERLRADSAGLAVQLGRGGRTVRLSVGAGTAEEVAVGSRLFDIALLCDHHVMDVSG